MVAALPPSLSDRSTRTTSRPSLAASSAAVRPVKPPPSTRMVWKVSGISGAGTRLLESFMTPIFT